MSELPTEFKKSVGTRQNLKKTRQNFKKVSELPTEF